MSRSLLQLLNSYDADQRWLWQPFAHYWPEEKARREARMAETRAEIERRFPGYVAKRARLNAECSAAIMCCEIARAA